MNKSDFVRSMGKRPAKEVVALAAKQGMKLTERYIYVIRSADKAKGRQTGGTVMHARAVATARAEDDFRRVVAELGLARSRAVLAEVERAFR